MALFQTRQAFTVPVTLGVYAPERVVLSSTNTSVISPPLLGVTVLVEAAPASATYELWLLQVNADPTVDGNYLFYDFASAGKTWALASFRGAQIRCKSGGVAGTTTLSVSAD